jgi:hypothetical protein
MTAPDQAPITTLRYEMTLDDLVAFNVHHQFFSEITRKKRERGYRILSVIGGLVYTLLGFMISTLMPSVLGWWFSAALGLTVGGLIYLVLRKRKPRVSKWLRKRIRDSYSATADKISLCEHVLEVSPAGLHKTTAYTETRCAWGALNHIEGGEGYTYLYIATNQAFVIPHGRITEGSLPDFLRAVKTFYKPDHLLEPAADA